MKIGNVILQSRTGIDTDICHNLLFDGNPLKVNKSYQKLLLIQQEKYCKYFCKDFDLNSEVTEVVKSVIPSTEKLDLTVINTHASSTLEYTREELVSTLIPKIGKYFDIKSIESIEASEQQFVSTSQKDLLKNKHFIALKVKFPGAIIKFQLSKERKKVSCTFIISFWTCDNLELFYFISGMATLHRNISELVKQLLATKKGDKKTVLNVILLSVMNNEVAMIGSELRLISQAGGETFVKRMGAALRCQMEWSTESQSSHLESITFSIPCPVGGADKVVVKNSSIQHHVEEEEDIVSELKRKIEEGICEYGGKTFFFFLSSIGFPFDRENKK